MFSRYFEECCLDTFKSCFNKESLEVFWFKSFGSRKFYQTPSFFFFFIVLSRQDSCSKTGWKVLKQYINGQKNFTFSLQFCLILKLGSQAILLHFVSDAWNFLEFWNNWKECMIFNCTVDKTLITFNTAMLKGLWRILFMMVLFSRSYLYKRM